MTNVKNLELFFLHAPVASLVELTAIDTTGIVDGEIIEVSSSGIFRFQTPAVKTPNGRDVITGNGGGVWVRLTLAELITTPAGAIDIASGGTGRTTAQEAINELVGAPVLARYFLRSDGVNVEMAAIQAADLPTTLTQDTTGTSSNVTSTVLYANGGTGETSRQAALNSLAGSVVGGTYLQGDGANVVMGGIDALDVPTLNQDTTGTAQYATNVAGGIENEIVYQTSAGITSFISPANNSVVITDGSSVPLLSSTLPSAVQGNITTVGTITSGTWSGGIVTGAFGGTGIDNGIKTITIGGNISTDGALDIIGAYDTELTTTGTTSLTLPVSGILATVDQLPEMTGYETVFNGIEEASLFSVTYDAATRVFSVTYSSGAAYTVNGVRYTPGAGTVTTTAHAATTGSYYLYYDQSGILTVSSTPWNLLTTAQLVEVYYTTSNAGGSADGFLQYEMHPGQKGMSNATHLNLHFTRGTQLINGCLASGYTLNTPGAANINWAVSAGTIADEDNLWPTTAQALGGANTYRIFYLTGAEASPSWNWVDVAEQGVYTDGTNIYYNQNNAGTFQLTAITGNNVWLNYYILETMAYNAPQVIVVMGQKTYSSESLADAATFADDVSNFGLLTSEAVILYEVTYRRAVALGAPGNCEISDFEQVIQSLVSSGVGGTIDASGVTTSTSSFTNFFTVTDGTVQECLNTLDANVPFSGAHGGTGVANTGKTITLGGSLTTSGAFGTTLTATGTTSLTLPTTGTLATTADLVTLPVPLASGGTNANLTASDGGIFYSTDTAGAILSGTATAGQMLQSGLSTAPAWSTATYPAATTVNQLLYSSAANTLAGLATANDGTLVTSAAGVPSISSTLPATVQGNITTLGTITTDTSILGSITIGSAGSNGTDSLYDSSSVLQTYLDASASATSFINASNGGIFVTGGSVGYTSNALLGSHARACSLKTGDYNPSILTSDYHIAFTSTAAAYTYTISTEDIQSGTTTQPRWFVVSDKSGDAATNNITIAAESGTVYGDAAIRTNYGKIIVYVDGTNVYCSEISTSQPVEETVTSDFSGPWATAQSVDVRFVRIGKQVTMTIPSILVDATVSSRIIMVEVIPPSFRPSATIWPTWAVSDDGVTVLGKLEIISATGYINIYATLASGAFAGTSAIGLTGFTDISVSWLTA